MSGKGQNKDFFAPIDKNVGLCMKMLAEEIQPNHLKLKESQLARRISFELSKNLINDKHGKLQMGDEKMNNEISTENLNAFYNEKTKAQNVKLLGNLVDKSEIPTELFEIKTGGKKDNPKEYKIFFYRIKDNNGNIIDLDCHISANQIKRYYEGQPIPYAILDAFCRVLGISFDVFMRFVYEKMVNSWNEDEVMSEWNKMKSVDARQESIASDKPSNTPVTDDTSSIRKFLADQNQNVLFVKRKDFLKNWMDLVGEARHDVFISGVALTQYVEQNDTIREISEKGISVKILILNLEDKAILYPFFSMIYNGRRSDHSPNRYLERQTVSKTYFPKNENIAYAVSDRIMPMSFFAVDIFTPSENSFIKVEHYLHDKETKEASLVYIIKPTHIYFETMKEQIIEILWKRSFTDDEMKTKKNISRISEDPEFQSQCDRIYQNQREAEKDLEEDISKSKSIKHFLMRGNTFLHKDAFLPSVFDNLKDEQEVKILLLDPNKSFAKLRAEEDGYTIEQFRNQIETNIELIKKKAKEKRKGQIECRLHNQPPVFRFFLFDDNVYFGFYDNENFGIQVKLFRVNKDSEFYKAFVRYFDFIWNCDEQ